MDFGSNSFWSPLTISTRRSVTDPNLGDAEIILGNFVITSRAHAATPQLGSPGGPVSNA
jgi:hypothetical protein